MADRTFGYWARRARKRRLVTFAPWVNVAAGALLTIPIGVMIESVTGRRGGLSSAKVWVVLVGTAVAASSIGLNWWVQHRVRLRRRRNGTFFYVSTFASKDRDQPRWEHLMKTGDAFETFPPIVSGPEPSLPEWIRSISDDLKHAFRPNDTTTPTHILTNMLWPYALAAGMCADSWPANTHLWWLDSPGSEWKGDPLIDVIVVDDLMSPAARVDLLALPELPELPARLGEATYSLGLSSSGTAAGGTVTAVFLALSGWGDAVLARKLEEVSADRRVVFGYQREIPCEHPGSKPGDELYIEPQHFGSLAAWCAQLLDDELKTCHQLYVATRLPKPLAFAIGIALRHRHGWSDAERAKVTLLNYDANLTREYHGLPLGTPSPDHEPAATVVSLLGHPTRILDADGNLMTEIAAVSGSTGARLVEQRTAADPIVVDGVTVPADAIAFGIPSGLPAPRPGIIFLVPRLLAMQCPARRDLVFPGDEVRDADGIVVGCRSLARIATR